MLDQNTLEAPSPTGSPEGNRTPDPVPAAAATTNARQRPAPVSADVATMASDEIEQLYIQHRTLLQYIACRKFRINELDAENLIQEVFLSFMQTGTKIENIRAWLVAAMCNASRHYWRAQGRTESLPDDIVEQCDPGSQGLADQFALRMTVRKVVRYLQPRCQDTLRLHYFEGKSAVDVAKELETTTRYAEKLIHNCLRRAREIYNNISNTTPRK